MGVETKITRRRFLQIAAGGTAAALFPGLSQPSAYGYHLDTGEEMAIAGTDSGYRYLVADGRTGKKVAMADVQVTSGYPFAGTKIYPRLGVRLDEPEFMGPPVTECGAARVRVRAPVESMGVSESNFEQAVTAAEAVGLLPLAVIDTNHSWEDKILQEAVAGVLAAHPTVVFEAGNEPDDLSMARWENRDLVSFAHFVKTVVGTVAESRWKNGVNTPVVIGALVDMANAPEYLKALKAAGVPLKNSNVRCAMHFYSNAGTDPNLEGIKNGTWEYGRQFYRAAGRYPEIDATEVGTNGSVRDKWRVIRMVEECYKRGMKNVYVHELLNHTDGHELDIGFGLAKADMSLRYPAYFGLQALVRMRS